MLKLFLVYYLTHLNLFECIKFNKSVELQQRHHVANVTSIIPSPAYSDPYHYRVGIGYDLHRLVRSSSLGRQLKLGGVSVPGTSVRVFAHSDGDVVLHSISDAILGALGKGDIGDYFSDSDPQFEGYDSSKILLSVVDLMSELKYVLVNVDVCIVLQSPKLGSLKSKIRENLGVLLGHNTVVNVKAKTNEGLDSIGSGSAVACHSVALLQHRN
ncbi:2-C-methyl-D-erythritol 2,4-cyclodiphosphate synthase [Theileria orientalis]|uniref:2-C-methyl-D-erythritol 2,4-cyclodiphosphate synthase n=1 Tax=Theileria orientalis TaxID=68886 RepID=A0A976SIX0_THEOR|nr:2-C-methyl-D-erythritol 2,4-cyclodiphosphate synthase [Theileria orientalis]